MKEKIKEKEEATKLRKLGYSYKEIAKILHISMGSCNLWLSSVKISDDAKQRLYIKQKNNWDLFSKRALTDKDMRIKISDSLKKYHNSLSMEDKNKRIAFFKNVVIPLSQLIFTEDENNIKKILDSLFKTNFKKEKIGNYIIDFANEKFAIEHTHDYGKGIYLAIKRLQAVPDNRIKILICHDKYFGVTRRKRAEGMIHWPVELFDKGSIPDNIKKLLNTN